MAAKSQGKLQYQVGFSVDKTGLREMQATLERISFLASQSGNGVDAGLKQAGQTAQKLSGILDKTFNANLGSLNMTKFNQELANAGLSLRSIHSDLTNAGSAGTLAGNMGASAWARLSNAVLGTKVQLKESNKLLDGMAKTMWNTVKWGVSASLFNNITGSIQRAFNYSRGLDTSLNNIRITTQKSADEMERFAKQANATAQALGSNTLDITSSALTFYQQGLSDEEVTERTRLVTEVANVTGQSASTVADEMTAVWNGFKASADDAELYIDKLANVAAHNATSLAEMANGMSKVAAAANDLGVNFDQLEAQMATIISVTRQAPESVGTALTFSA